MISILMATYNGERFLAEQIESVLGQTYQDFIIYIHDDNSRDGSWETIMEYSGRFPDKIRAFQNDQNTGGAKYNFLRMMLSYRGDYLMLCDQDDFWQVDKIEVTIRKMWDMEEAFGRDTPLLVHTDLCVVDRNLEVISESFREAMNANYDRTQLRDQIIQNTLTGCTVLYNRALADLIIAAPPYMIMHDWWLMLIASAFGHIGHVDSKTVLYRQHGDNVIGAKNVRTLRYKINRLINYAEIRQALVDTYTQAQSFLNVYHERLSVEQRELLEIYCSIPTMNKFHRWRTICRLGVLKNGIARKIANFIFV